MGGKLGITSNEIADTTGKRHDNIRRDIAERIGHLKNEGISVPVESTYIDGSNRVKPNYIMGRDFVSALMSGYDFGWGLEMAEAFRMLEEAVITPPPAPVLTYDEHMLVALQMADGKVKEQQKQITVMEPKAEFYDTVVASDKWVFLADIVKQSPVLPGHITLFHMHLF